MAGPTNEQGSEQTPDAGEAERGDVKAAFRRALERKSAHHHPDEDHRDAHGAPGAANDTTKRVFRRKSG